MNKRSRMINKRLKMIIEQFNENVILEGRNSFVTLMLKGGEV